MTCFGEGFLYFLNKVSADEWAFSRLHQHCSLSATTF